MVGEVPFGEVVEGGLFAGRYGFERVAECGSPAQLYLDEDEGGSFADDEIYLPPARPVVALDEPVAAPREVA